MISELWWIDVYGVEYRMDEAGLGLVLLDGILGLDAPPVETRTAPRSDAGAVLVAQRHTVRPVTLPLFFDGTSHREDMAAFLDSMHLGPGQLRYVDDSGRERILRSVVYDGGFEGDESQVRYDWSQRVVNLLALDPYWYDEATSIVLGPAEADYAFSDGTVAFNQASAFSGAAAGISGSALFNDAVSFNTADVGFSGGAIVAFPPLTSPIGIWPTFTIHGPASYLRIDHLRTGEVIELLPTTQIPEGRSMVVITRPEDRAVLFAGVDAWDRVTAETSATMQILPGQYTPLTDPFGVPLLDSSGRPIVVQGEQDELAIILQGTTGASYIEVAWEERWLTP
jgi:hypothetical protein